MFNESVSNTYVFFRQYSEIFKFITQPQCAATDTVGYGDSKLENIHVMIFDLETVTQRNGTVALKLESFRYVHLIVLFVLIVLIVLTRVRSSAL